MITWQENTKKADHRADVVNKNGFYCLDLLSELLKVHAEHLQAGLFLGSVGLKLTKYCFKLFPK